MTIYTTNTTPRTSPPTAVLVTDPVSAGHILEAAATLKKGDVVKVYLGSTEMNFWSGTKAEFEALDHHQANTNYIYEGSA